MATENTDTEPVEATAIETAKATFVEKYEAKLAESKPVEVDADAEEAEEAIAAHKASGEPAQPLDDVLDSLGVEDEADLDAAIDAALDAGMTEEEI